MQIQQYKKKTVKKNSECKLCWKKLLWRLCRYNNTKRKLWKRILSVSCVEKSCCDDSEDTTINKELLSVSCVEKSCCDDCADTTIHKRNPECKLCWKKLLWRLCRYNNTKIKLWKRNPECKLCWKKLLWRLCRYNNTKRKLRKRILSVSCVEKSCCDDCADTTIQKENCEKESWV